MLQKMLVLGVMATASGLTPAQSVDATQLPDAAAFKSMVEDTGAMAGYRGQLPAEPQGLTGFDLGFSVSHARLQNTAVYQSATTALKSDMYWASLHAHKGLPGGWDLGAFISSGMDGNGATNGIDQRGVELRFAVLDGGALLPAVGVRASATELTGIKGYTLKTQGVDVSISKGLAMLTPYAGLGLVKAKGSAGAFNDSVTLNKTFVGIGANLLLINFNLEYDKTGDVPSYSVKAGWRF